MKIRSIAYFTQYTHLSAIEEVRVYSPLKTAGLNVIAGIKRDTLNLKGVDQADLILFQRDFAQDLNRYEQIVNYGRSQNKAIVYDIDDLLLFLPETHPDRLSSNFGPALLPMFQSIIEAGLVTVSTQKLKETLLSFNSNITVLPNYLDESIWQLKNPIKEDKKDRPITLGYMGGGSHTPDLEFIVPVLSNLFNRYKNKLQFIVWGLEPPKALLRFPQTKWIRVSSYNYRDFAKYFQKQQADIFIAPLVDNLFNRCKSAIKFLEYAALGSPCVFSKLDPYKDVIIDGYNGFLANSDDEWQESLIRLIENKDLRYELALNAQETVRENWLLSKNAQKWPAAYQNVNNIAPVQSGQAVTFQFPLFKSITQQIFELSQNQKIERQSLNHQLQIERQNFDHQLEEQDHQLQEQDHQLQERDHQLEEQDHQLQEQDHQLQERDRQLQEQDYIIQRLNVRLASKTVAIARVIERYYNRLVPEGSVRVNIVKRFVHFAERIFVTVFRRNYPSSDENLIRSSPFFAEDWYLTTNPDVAKLNLDPANHYLKYGGFEGRDPGPNFSNSFYLSTYADAKKVNINPLLHYILYGAAEGRKTQPSNQRIDIQLTDRGKTQDPQKTEKVVIKEKRKAQDLGHYFKRSLILLKEDGLVNLLKRGKRKLYNQIIDGIPQETDDDPNKYDASIVIPVYNAANFTKACIEKIYSSPNVARYEVIVVDNGSQDETETLLTEEQKRRKDFSYYRMSENFGFSGGVNIGFLRAIGKHIIILNNDTLVTPGWIDRMIEAFKQDELIGIVSPITNYVGEGNQVDPEAKDIDPNKIDAYAETILDRGIIYESHRLVFFCVALKREVIDHLGLMDTGYVKGNFEDDDYCVRAILAGFKLAIARNAFVYHFGSMTFKTNKILHDDYMDQNRKRFYPKVQSLSLTLKPPKQLTGKVNISVVVRTLNRPNLLKKALISLSNQTYRDFEVVIVNDGGKDISDMVAFFEKYFPIQYIHYKKSKGRTPALNAGVTESKGEWITFLDDDDIVYPWHLDLLYGHAPKEKSHRFVYSNYNRSIFRTNNDDYALTLQGVEPWPFDKKELWVSNRIPIHTWLIQRSCFEEVGLFDESMSMLEDFEFLVRLSKKTDFYHVNRISCEYRYYLDGINSMVNQRAKTLEALKSIFVKHPSQDPEIKWKRELELEALAHQIKTIDGIKAELAQDPEHAEDYQRKMLSQILGIS